MTVGTEDLLVVISGNSTVWVISDIGVKAN